MQILKRIVRDKGIVDEDNIVSTVSMTQEATKDLEYPTPVLNSLMSAPQSEVRPIKEKYTRTNLIDQQYMEYTPYQAYPNYPFHYPIINCIPFEPKNPQQKVPITSRI